jgi:hypothetical protein
MHPRMVAMQCHSTWSDLITLPESHTASRSTLHAPTFVSDRISSISSLDRKKKRGKYSLKDRQHEVQEVTPMPFFPTILSLSHSLQTQTQSWTTSKSTPAEQKACVS